mmetsp:Transcript_46630/g.101722  ORF Transcript_46630/g.101722 Transcript_46630/m.101722 type:complete len:187 (+) Transcript_46630:1-561(+)
MLPAPWPEMTFSSLEAAEAFLDGLRAECVPDSGAAGAALQAPAARVLTSARSDAPGASNGGTGCAAPAADVGIAEPKVNLRVAPLEAPHSNLSLPHSSAAKTVLSEEPVAKAAQAQAQAQSRLSDAEEPQAAEESAAVGNDLVDGTTEPLLCGSCLLCSSCNGALGGGSGGRGVRGGSMAPPPGSR